MNQSLVRSPKENNATDTKAVPINWISQRRLVLKRLDKAALFAWETTEMMFMRKFNKQMNMTIEIDQSAS